MTKKALVTICSREKSRQPGLLPAIKRYESERITTIYNLAKKSGYDFFILSGEFGIVAAKYEIPYYDHLLLEEEVPVLVPKVVQQIKANDVDEVIFYSKLDSKNWRPYNILMEESADLAGVKLEVVGLD